MWLSQTVKCFGDEIFLVKCFQDGAEVYCFDKEFSFPEDCALYRKERDRRALERSHERRRMTDKIVRSQQLIETEDW